MEGSSLHLMTCDELREEFAKCPDDINKRILIIDVRNSALYERSHLCLDARNINISSIRSKMRVMNIDPDLVKVCTIKNIMSILPEEDLNIFKKRKNATEVVLIDNNTDNISELTDPKSKVMRIINGLTKFDNQIDDKIIVPIHVLKGGFREWLMKYPHFTTDSTFNTDIQVNDLEPLPQTTSPNTILSNHILTPSSNGTTCDIKDHPLPMITNNSDQILSTVVNPTITPPVIPPKPTPPISQVIPTSPSSTSQTKQAITKPVLIPPTNPAITTTTTIQAPTRVVPSTPKPAIVKNAPGTAVPVTPALHLRCPLPRSHSSPNVAQADGDEPENELTEHLENFKTQLSGINLNNNHSAPITVKPRFDRTLKPALNNEIINAIRAQINFGRSPESSGKAITGLQNLGNTCFMNSVIQCLAYAPTLVSYFCSDSYYNHINFHSQYGSKGELAVEFGALVERLNSHRHRYIEPKSFREAIIKHIGFAGNEQQDSHEFMMMLFDKLHHDLNIHAKDNKLKQNGIVSNGNDDDSNINIPRATLGFQFWKRHLEMNKSIISDLFEGIFMSTLTCTFCRGQSNTFEVFNCLSLPIPSDSRCHLKDCLNHFSNPERIEAAWECPRCKQKREADKKIVICKLPRILIVHLKRFSLDGRWRQKLQTTVDFPLTDLGVDCTNVLPQSAYGSGPIKSNYNLYAVVNHYGHLDGGHYTAFCKLENQRWYTFDDSNVTEMKDMDVCGQAAYILFYGSGY